MDKRNLESLSADTEAFSLSPETRILGADFVWHALSDCQPGDPIVAFDAAAPERGKHRKLRIAQIAALQLVRQPARRMELADDRAVVSSAGVSWLSARSGRGPRSMMCDQCGLSFERWQGLSAHRRFIHGAPGTWQQQGFGTWITSGLLRPETVIKNLGLPWGEDNSRGAGYLGGVYDGEASFQIAVSQSSFCITFPQKPGVVLDCTRRLLAEKGFRQYEVYENRESGVCVFPIRGIYDCFRFLGQCRPLRLLETSGDWLDGHSFFNRHGDGSIAVAVAESIGSQDMLAVTTTTGTLIAEGLFARVGR